ncbi:hypothetical protein [Alicyclobacillus acidoterrestris]|uniref:Uncharacterized protein n=1 Tax=Alicyclobacillus acidoterrestris (strain ATCC 49025 / DSM 3922 / CIP 106132 / NCIMB 13137 / GD3B) TaxID=1356854 RepID=T0DUE2_ALIAG|nr:hypothetical protein [Alicyclobacillus acidoterrestris]EPZ53066.1 hypothetical protein N007_18550 [Alicyclobacillus acidoterrestris ATCC 49025]UNO47176.1 hypothetical protein K1I37_10460 [Alicyclobacillus acidoterrestris]
MSNHTRRFHVRFVGEWTRAHTKAYQEFVLRAFDSEANEPRIELPTQQANGQCDSQSLSQDEQDRG